jgi:hypothetical protein
MLHINEPRTAIFKLYLEVSISKLDRTYEIWFTYLCTKPKRDGVTGEQRSLHNEELYDL